MNKRLILVVLGFLSVLATVAPATAAEHQVMGTFTVADLGQGVWGGGSLFSDGTASGNIPFSASIANAGQTVFQLQPTSWSWLDPSTVVLCLDVRVIQNPAGLPFPPAVCIPMPVTGGPVPVDENNDGNPDFITRLHLNGAP